VFECGCEWESEECPSADVSRSPSSVRVRTQAGVRAASKRGCEQKSERYWRRKIHTSTMGRGVKDARIRLEVDKHTGEP
jgi:hypothetical protein